MVIKMEKEIKKITKDMPIGDVVIKHPETAEVFMKHGLHCLGCAIAQFESIEQGCQVHGIDANKLVDDLNKSINNETKVRENKTFSEPKVSELSKESKKK